MTWREAFTALAAISVPGVATSFDLDELPTALPAASLPALAPAFPQSGGEAGLATLTYDGSVWQAALRVDHVLYWQPAWSEGGLSAVLPDLIDTVDAYLTAVSEDGTLGDVLDYELTLRAVLPGVVTYAGVRFYGAVFQHEWLRRVA
ncbi:MAG: hypothetical protein GYB64_13540 [Chloroflexi bacterium]|nr:hypothetical protein [Chloroflexota bacterium]